MKVKQKSVQGRERHQENKIKTKQSRAEQSRVAQKGGK